jgi:hypothetical protein
MHPLPLLTTLTTLLVTALGAPAPSPALTPPSASHRLVARDGPCDAFSETCRPVINANACFAAYVMLGEREQMLQCVDHEDAARAEELVSCGPLQGGVDVCTDEVASCASAMAARRRRCRSGLLRLWGVRRQFEALVNRVWRESGYTAMWIEWT